MGLGVHIGVDAQADAGALAFSQRHLVEHQQLGFALDVEAAYAHLQRAAHLGARLADAGEDHLGRVAAGGQHPLQLTAGDDVKAAAGPRKHLQHAERRIGLHRVADLHLVIAKAALVGLQRGQHGGLGIDEQRRAVLARQLGGGQLFDVQLLAPVGDVRLAGQEGRGGGQGTTRCRKDGRSAGRAGGVGGGCGAGRGGWCRAQDAAGSQRLGQGGPSGGGGLGRQVQRALLATSGQRRGHAGCKDKATD